MHMCNNTHAVLTHVHMCACLDTGISARHKTGNTDYMCSDMNVT